MKSKATLLLLIIFSMFFIALTYSFTLEDAQITYRYALRYSEGYPWATWNRSDPPVEGFTTVLWMYILSLFGTDLDAIAHGSKIIGVLSYFSLAGWFYFLSCKVEKKETLFIECSDCFSKSLLFVSYLCLLSIPIMWYASSGMETVTYMLLISLSLTVPLVVDSIFTHMIVCFLLVLIRPEGIAFALSSSIFYSFWNKRYLWSLVFSVVIISLVFVLRFEYFGAILPNTFYAKSGDAGLMHIKYGILYFGSFAASYWYLFLPFLFAPYMFITNRMSLKKDYFIVLISTGVFLYFCIIAKSGGDNFSAFPHWRHGLILLPLLALCSFYLVFKLFGKRGSKVSIGLLLLGVLAPIFIAFPSSQSFYKYIKSEKVGFRNDFLNNPMFLWLREHNDSDITIATSLAGALPLTVDFNHIDILGLNDSYIALNGSFNMNGPVDSKSDMRYVLSRSPEIIEAYVKPQCVIDYDESCLYRYRGRMAKELFESPHFISDYLLIKNAPYQYFNRAMFIHRDYYYSRGINNGIEAIEWGNAESKID
jgi:hypothetical protein